jgi:membrane-bound lytic murein transglycosylase B
MIDPLFAKSPALLARRHCLQALLGGIALLTAGVQAAQARQPFPEWVESFRARARARGISDATYDRVMAGLKPDTSVYELDRRQPEFTEELWQYINRRVSDWRIDIGKQRAQEHAKLLTGIERDFGVDRYTLLGLWGMESVFGNVIDDEKYMRRVFPALAALAWGEPRRRKYWEQELLNALVIVERGWAKPDEMVGSWAGAMGHTQWMPEVWLNVGVDYDADGRIWPFGKPDDALAGTAQYLLKRGRYRRGEAWGYEAQLPPKFKTALADRKTWHSYERWSEFGVTRADGKPFPRPNDRARLWLPAEGGPAFLLGQNFYAARSYNPSYNYALALVHLGDRIRGDGPFRQQFPGGERAMTLAELQEVQQRLTKLGYDTGGTDGRVGSGTMRAVRQFQERAGLHPADGYPGLRVLARLRQGL